MKEKVSKEEADEMKKVLEAVGGTVEIGVWNIVQWTKFGIKMYVVLTHVPFLLILLIIKKTKFCPAMFSKGWFRLTVYNFVVEALWPHGLFAWLWIEWFGFDKLTTTLQNECCRILIIRTGLAYATMYMQVSEGSLPSPYWNKIIYLYNLDSQGVLGELIKRVLCQGL